MGVENRGWWLIALESITRQTCKISRAIPKVATKLLPPKEPSVHKLDTFLRSVWRVKFYDDNASGILGEHGNLLYLSTFATLRCNISFQVVRERFIQKVSRDEQSFFLFFGVKGEEGTYVSINLLGWDWCIISNFSTEKRTWATPHRLPFKISLNWTGI